jgi:O-antigen/teichoic acid export membrane protein
MIARSLASLGVRVAGAAASFGFQVLLARLLGSASLGVYHTANTASQMIAVFGRRGLDGVLLRHASVAHGEQRLASTHATVVCAVRTVLKNTALTIVLMAVLALLAGNRWLDHGDAVPSLLMFLLAALPVALVAVYGEALKAVGLPVTSAAVQGLVLPLLNLMGVVVLSSHVASASTASGVYLLSALAATGVAAGVWRHVTRRWDAASALMDAGKLTREAWPFFIAAMASTLAGSADLLILSVFGRSEEVGIYAVASRIAVLFALISVGVNGVVAPQFAQRASARDTAALRRLSWKACTLTAVAGLPLLAVSLVLPAPLLELFGPDFTDGVLVLQLVVAGRYINLISGPLGHLLQMTGSENIERNLLCGMAAALICMAVPLTIAYGATGAAAAACVAWTGLGVARCVAAAAMMRGGLPSVAVEARVPDNTIQGGP